MKIEEVPAGGGVWYLASPYSTYPAGWEAACRDVACVAASLLHHKVLVFSPITHSHPIGLVGSVKPDDLPAWEALDRPFMEMAVGCIVAMLPNWQNSTGVSNEVRWFVEQNKPLIYLDVDDLPVSQPSDAQLLASMVGRRPTSWGGPVTATATAELVAAVDSV